VQWLEWCEENQACPLYQVQFFPKPAAYNTNQLLYSSLQVGKWPQNADLAVNKSNTI
jgi:hypothetical protein